MFSTSEKHAISLVVGALLLITGCAPVASPQGGRTEEGPSAPRHETTQMTAGDQGPAEEPQGYGAAAGLTNILYIPLKSGFCVFSGVVGVVAMIGSLGTRYDAPTRFVQAGCGGPWVLTGDDMQRLMADQNNRTY